jgi:hypothetical protein
MFKNISIYIISFAISTLVGVCLLNPLIIHAQQAIPDVPTVKHYFPYSNGTISDASYGIGMRKWYSLSDTIINFYVIPLGEKLWNGTDSIDIAWDVFTKAVQVWNSQNIGISLNIVGFAASTDEIKQTTTKNLLGFGNTITSAEDKQYGATSPYNRKYVIYADKYHYETAQTAHLELNIDLWKGKALVLQTPAPISTQYPDAKVLNVYAVAVHELGHVLGLKDNCGGIQSIMGSPDWEGDGKAYDVQGISALPNRDKLMIRALYPNIIPGRASETRLPK